MRQSYPESPPRVEYELTDKGVALLPIIEEMRSFGHDWLIVEHEHAHEHAHLAGGELRLSAPDGCRRARRLRRSRAAAQRV